MYRLDIKILSPFPDKLSGDGGAHPMTYVVLVSLQAEIRHSGLDVKCLVFGQQLQHVSEVFNHASFSLATQGQTDAKGLWGKTSSEFKATSH